MVYFYIKSTLIVNRYFSEVSISFSVINTINRSGYSKKTGPLRKFKSGTSDKTDPDIEKSIENLYF